MTDVWIWQGRKLHIILVKSNFDPHTYATLCGLVMHDPSVYHVYGKIPRFIRQRYCKNCQRSR